MGQMHVLLVFLIVICHRTAAYEEQLTSGSDEEPNMEVIPNYKQSLYQQPQNFETILSPNSLDRIQAAVSRGFDYNRDEDHHNIDVDKLNEAYRYEFSPTSNLIPTTKEVAPYSLSSKVLGIEFARGQNERKRNIRRQLNLPKEDKDYSFVGTLPVRYAPPPEDRAGRYLALRLRDMILAHEQAHRLAEESNRNTDKLSQVSLRSFGNLRNANDILPTNREKRRRCKIETNAGAKNPSGCDSETYFGANDYITKDIWESAGR